MRVLQLMSCTRHLSSSSKTDLLFPFLVLQYLYQNHTFYCMKRKRLWLFLLRDAMQAMLWKKWDFLDILDLMEETFFWCNISQAVTLGLLLFCLEFRPCTALQTFFWVSLHFFARFKHILRRSQLPPRLLPILCTEAAALSFLIEYFVLETNFQLRRLCRQRLWFIGH